MAKKRDIPPIHPGEILLEEFLVPMEISQYRLIRRIFNVVENAEKNELKAFHPI